MGWKIAFGMAILAILFGSALPATAQYPGSSPTHYQNPSDQDNLRTAVTNLNAQRSEFYRKKNLDGVVSEYTPDALYIQLMPNLSVMKGREQIKRHFQELMEANATDLVLTVTNAQMTGNDTLKAGGSYFVAVAGGKKVYGHFYQELRRDGGTWKIAKHIFARPEPVTTLEMKQYNNGG